MLFEFLAVCASLLFGVCVSGLLPDDGVYDNMKIQVNTIARHLILNLGTPPSMHAVYVYISL